MIKSIKIEDSIELSQTGAIEVLLEMNSGERRWCFFFTPEGVAACGDYIEGTKVRFHYGAAHMFIVSEISEQIIHAALKDIEKQNLIESCTKLVQ